MTSLAEVSHSKLTNFWSGVQVSIDEDIHRTQYEKVEQLKHENELNELLTRHHPYLMHPEITPWKFWWDLWMSGLVIYTLVMSPFEIGFSVVVDGSTPLGFFDNIVVTVFFGVDIIFNFFTAFYDDNLEKWNFNQRDIAGNYLKFWFWVDALATVPVDIIIETLNTASQLKLSRMSRLFRLARLFRIFRTLRNSRLENYILPSFLNTLIVLCQIFLTVHIFACGWHYIATPDNVDQLSFSTNWIDAYGFTSANLDERYVASLYFIFVTMTSIGYGDILPTNELERFFAIITMFTGTVVFGGLLAQVAVFLQTNNPQERRYRARLQEFTDLLLGLQLPKLLQQRARQAYSYALTQQTILQNSDGLEYLAQPFATELIYELYRDDIARIHFFHAAPPSFVVHIMRHAKAFEAFSDDILYEEGDMFHEIIFIKVGKVAISVHDGVKCHYLGEVLEGSLIGDIEYHLQSKLAITQYKAIHDSGHFLSVSVDVMKHCLEEHGELHDQFKQTIKLRAESLQKVIKRRLKRELPVTLEDARLEVDVCKTSNSFFAKELTKRKQIQLQSSPPSPNFDKSRLPASPVRSTTSYIETDSPHFFEAVGLQHNWIDGMIVKQKVRGFEQATPSKSSLSISNASTRSDIISWHRKVRAIIYYPSYRKYLQTLGYKKEKKTKTFRSLWWNPWTWKDFEIFSPGASKRGNDDFSEIRREKMMPIPHAEKGCTLQNNNSNERSPSHSPKRSRSLSRFSSVGSNDSRSQSLYSFHGEFEHHTESFAYDILDQATLWRKHYLLHPNFKAKLIWDGCMAIIIIVTIIILPIQITFQGYTPFKAASNYLFLAVDGCFFVDMVLTFRTAVFAHGEDVIICDVWYIWEHYLRSWFLCDFLSTFPAELLFPEDSNELNTATTKFLKAVRLFRLMKLARALKLHAYVEIFEVHMKLPSAVSKIALLLFQLYFVVHCIACIWWGIPSVMSDDPWYTRLSQSANSTFGQLGGNDVAVGSQYLASIYYTVATMTTVGFGDIHPFTMEERILCMFILLFGAMMFGYMISNIGNAINGSNIVETLRIQRLSEVTIYLKEKHCTPDISKRILKHFKKQMQESSGFDVDKINTYLPTMISIPLLMIIHEKVMSKITLFDYLSNHSIAIYLFQILQPVYCAPGQYLMRQSIPSTELIFLVTGRAKLFVCKPITIQSASHRRSRSKSSNKQRSSKQLKQIQTSAEETNSTQQQQQQHEHEHEQRIEKDDDLSIIEEKEEKEEQFVQYHHHPASYARYRIKPSKSPLLTPTTATAASIRHYQEEAEEAQEEIVSEEKKLQETMITMPWKHFAALTYLDYEQLHCQYLGECKATDFIGYKIFLQHAKHHQYHNNHTHNNHTYNNTYKNHIDTDTDTDHHNPWNIRTITSCTLYTLQKNKLFQLIQSDIHHTIGMQLQSALSKAIYAQEITFQTRFLQQEQLAFQDRIQRMHNNNNITHKVEQCSRRISSSTAIHQPKDHHNTSSNNDIDDRDDVDIIELQDIFTDKHKNIATIPATNTNATVISSSPNKLLTRNRSVLSMDSSVISDDEPQPLPSSNSSSSVWLLQTFTAFFWYGRDATTERQQQKEQRITRIHDLQGINKVMDIYFLETTPISSTQTQIRTRSRKPFKRSHSCNDIHWEEQIIHYDHHNHSIIQISIAFDKNTK